MRNKEIDETRIIVQISFGFVTKLFAHFVLVCACLFFVQIRKESLKKKKRIVNKKQVYKQSSPYLQPLTSLFVLRQLVRLKMSSWMCTPVNHVCKVLTHSGLQGVNSRQTASSSVNVPDLLVSKALQCNLMFNRMDDACSFALSLCPINLIIV